MGIPERDPLAQLSLPPGFRFYPTDEELMVQYLCKKVAGHHFSLQIIAEIDLYKFDPWVLPGKAMFGEKEWYFFSPRDRKYPNGSRPNRVAGSGYWKATGTDKVIMTAGKRIGIKKALVFYVGKAPKGTKTNWIMHEYRLIEPSRRNGSSKLDEWVLCRVYEKNSNSNSSSARPTASSPLCTRREYSNNGSSTTSSSHYDDVLEPFNSLQTDLDAVPAVDWASLACLNSVPTDDRILGYTSHDLYGPAVPSLCHVDRPFEDEVQSGFRTQPKFDNSRFMTQNTGMVTQGFGSFDPYGLRFPGQTGGFGFLQ